MKKTILRKALALLLCAALCTGLLPAAFADGNAAQYSFPAPVVEGVEYMNGAVEVTWHHVLNAPRYGVFRSENGGPWRGLASVNSLYYRDEYVEPGVTYSYTVCCISSDGRSILSAFGESSLSVTIPTGRYMPVQVQTPVLLEARNVSRGVQVSWQPVSGAAQYGIFRSTEGGPWRGLAAVMETSYIDRAVEPDTTYTYTVCCLSADGRSILSPYDENGRTVRTDWISDGGALIYVQPTDTAVRQMTYASFTARGAGSELTYSWEMQAKDSAQWYTLPEIAWLIGGVNTDTLIIAAVLGLDGYSFRCRISDGQHAEYTKTVMLHVSP